MSAFRQMTRYEVTRKLAAAESNGWFALMVVLGVVATYYIVLISVFGLTELIFEYYDYLDVLLGVWPLFIFRSMVHGFESLIAGNAGLRCPRCLKLLSRRRYWMLVLQTGVCPLCGALIVGKPDDIETEVLPARLHRSGATQ